MLQNLKIVQSVQKKKTYNKIPGIMVYLIKSQQIHLNWNK